MEIDKKQNGDCEPQNLQKYLVQLCLYFVQVAIEFNKNYWIIE